MNDRNFFAAYAQSPISQSKQLKKYANQTIIDLINNEINKCSSNHNTYNNVEETFFCGKRPVGKSLLI
jgi:hypothetical protein